MFSSSSDSTISMFDRFRHRSSQLERLDIGAYTDDEYAKWQIEMRLIHRTLGEMRALRKSLFKDILSNGTNHVSILDVAAGSGNLLQEIRKRLATRNPFLVGAELDISAAKTIREASIDAVCCDALRLPFSNASFDFVTCSLFLHHLADDSAVQLLKEMRRVSRMKVIVIDLHRSPVAYYFYRTVAPLMFQRFTSEDGALSILRSFKPHELQELAEAAGLKNIAIQRSASYRLVLSGN